MDDQPNGRCLVAVVDDDESVRESLPDLLREVGRGVRGCAAAEGSLAAGPQPRPLPGTPEVPMPGMGGPELQRELQGRGLAIPVVFIPAHGDETVRPRLLQQGAVDCLFKPFSET